MKNSLDHGRQLLGFDWKWNCSGVSGPAPLFSHMTACARPDRTGLSGSLVRTTLSGFIETKNLCISTLTTLCCAFFLFKSLFFSQRRERFWGVWHKLTKEYPSLSHSTLHIKSACITSLLVVFGTRVYFISGSVCK